MASPASTTLMFCRSSNVPSNTLLTLLRGGQGRFMSSASSRNNNRSSDFKPSGRKFRRRNISSTSSASKSSVAAAETTAAFRQNHARRQHKLSSSPSKCSPTVSTAAAAPQPSSLSSPALGPLISELNKLSLKDRATILPVLGNMGYLALASGFLCTDMLELRVLLVGGYGCLVSYHFLQPKPLTIPLWGSGFFVVVNAIAAGLLVADRYAPSLNSTEHPDGEQLYEEHFQGLLTRGQFHQLLSLAKREKLRSGTVLTRENQVCDKMYFIVKGQAHLFHGRTPLSDGMVDSTSTGAGSYTDSRRSSTAKNILRRMTSPRGFALDQPKFATIEQGGFVNDVAFNRGADVGAYGTVIISNNKESTSNSYPLGVSDKTIDDVSVDGDDDYSVVLTWDTTELRDHLASRPDMDRSMKFCMSDHLVKSLMRQREAAHRRQQEQQQVSSTTTTESFATATAR